MKSKSDYYRVYRDYLIGGHLIGVLGSRSYILDPQTLEPISNGYSNFWMEKGTLMGSHGATDERVMYDTDAEQFDEPDDPNYITIIDVENKNVK